MALSQSGVRTEVRRRLDEIVFSGQSTTTESDIESSSSSTFSDEDLNERILDACRWAAAIADSIHLETLKTSTDPTSSWDESNVLRLLGSTVTINGNTASRRVYQEDRKAEAVSSRQATDSDPTFWYSDADLVLRDGGGLASTGESTDNLNDTSPSVDYITKVSAVSDLGDRLFEPVVQRTLVYCYLTLEEGDRVQSAQQAAIQEIQPYAVPRAQLGNDGS